MTKHTILYVLNHPDYFATKGYQQAEAEVVSSSSLVELEVGVEAEGWGYAINNQNLEFTITNAAWDKSLYYAFS